MLCGCGLYDNLTVLRWQGWLSKLNTITTPFKLSGKVYLFGFVRCKQMNLLDHLWKWEKYKFLSINKVFQIFLLYILYFSLDRAYIIRKKSYFLIEYFFLAHLFYSLRLLFFNFYTIFPLFCVLRSAKVRGWISF